MKTLTFFSYKGGVGRTLAATNYAIYAALTGRRVVLVDFDLDAPGVDAKLQGPIPSRQKGVLDYLLAFQEEERRPDSIKEFLYAVPLNEATGTLWVMPAGIHDSPTYPAQLQLLDWASIFADSFAGIALFQDLLGRMELEMAADLVVVDSRSGISEIANVCTQQLGDQVVLITTNARESIRTTARLVQTLRDNQIAQALVKARDRHVLVSRLPRPAETELVELTRSWSEQLVVDPHDISFLFSSPILAGEEFTALETPFRDIHLSLEYVTFFLRLEASDTTAHDAGQRYRQELLKRGLRRILQEAAPEIEPLFKGQILELCAAFEPFSLSHDSLLGAFAAILHAEPERLRASLESLKRAGVLRLEDEGFLIDPPEVASLLLRGACISPEGALTGFADRVFSLCPAEWRSSFLRNLARLPWRLGPEYSPNPLTRIWALIEEEFRGASGQERFIILRQIAAAAPYQPGPVLRLIDIALHSPQEIGIAVRHELARLLDAIAKPGPDLAQICDLLWDLGRDEKKGQSTPAAIATLLKLASYHPRKPIFIQKTVLDGVARWLTAPGAHDHFWSPMDILDRVLVRRMEWSQVVGQTIQVTSGVITPESVGELRNRALEIVAEVALHGPPRGVSRAISSLFETLHPIGIDSDNPEPWLPERLHVLSILEQIVRQPQQAAALLMIRKKLVWIAGKDPQAEVKAKATSILEAVPDNLSLRLTDYLCSSDEAPAVEPGLFEAFLAAYENPVQAFAILAELVSAIKTFNLSIEQRAFAEGLAQRRPRHILCFSDLVLEQPDSMMAQEYAPYLPSLRKIDKVAFFRFCNRVLEAKMGSLPRAIATYYSSYWDWPANFETDDQQVLQRILSSNDNAMVELGLRALRILGHHAPLVTVKLLRGVEIGASQSLADALCQVFDPWVGPGPGLSLNDVSDEELAAIVDKLLPIGHLEGAHIGRLLSGLLQRAPDLLVNVLLKRVQFAGESDAFINAVPIGGFYHLGAQDGFSGTEQQNRLLRKVRERFLQSTPVNRYGIGALFAALARGLPTALSMLDDWFHAVNCQEIVAAIELIAVVRQEGDAMRIHASGGASFVVQHQTLIATSLQQASQIGQACLEEVRRSWFSLLSGRRVGAVKELIANEEDLRDTARKLADEAPPDSVERSFYQDLIGRSEGWLRSWLERESLPLAV